MSKVTRIDIFHNLDEYIAFMEWAKTKNPKTKTDMVRLLGEYKKADIWVDAHPEIVEHRLTEDIKAGKFKKQTGENK